MCPVIAKKVQMTAENFSAACYTHTRTQAHTRTHTRTHAYTHACMHAHTHRHACTHIHTQAHTRTHMHTHMHARTHTHTHGHARTHAHSQTHILSLYSLAMSLPETFVRVLLLVLPQVKGQQKFPELITGASGGMRMPTAVTQCTCARVCVRACVCACVRACMYVYCVCHSHTAETYCVYA